MSALPQIYLARHGETAWTLSGQHTGRTDLPLTPNGERNAVQLGKRLRPLTFAKVFTSPLQRAAKSCALAGFNDATVDPDLVEWNYGEVEGLTSAEIRKTRPNWSVFDDGGPGGEGVADISARADRVIARVRAVGGDVLIFSSGHFLRVVAARWCGAEASWGRTLLLSTASLGILGYDHNVNEPVIRLWNDTSHVG